MPQARRSISAAERHRMIAEAAYYLAEKRNFQAGDSLQDWLRAERLIESQLAGKPKLALRQLDAAESTCMTPSVPTPQRQTS